jgi:threonine/homoserine/homoserine lactone efflux protein
LLVALVVVVTPGQDTALTIRNTLVGGRRAGVFSALGVVTGQVTWTLAAAAGLSALLVASEPAFLAVRIAGAAYLVFLGAHSLWLALRGHTAQAALRRPALSPARAYRQGLLSNLGNAKIAVFFTSLLPQFAPMHASFADFVALGLVLCASTLCWLTLYAFVVARAGDVLRRSRVRRLLEAATGSVLVALGIRVAAESR